MGMNAWGAELLNQPFTQLYDGENEIKAITSYGFTEVSENQYGQSAVTGGKLQYTASAYGTGKTASSEVYTGFTTTSSGTVTLSFTWATGGATGASGGSGYTTGNSTYTGFYFADSEGKKILSVYNFGQLQKMLVNGTSDTENLLASSVTRSQTYTVTATINLDTKIISSLRLQGTQTFTATNIPFENSSVTSVSRFGIINKVVKADNTSTVDDIVISKQENNCIINLVNSSDVVLKTYAAVYNDFSETAELTLYYPRYIKINDVWYQCAVNSTNSSPAVGKKFTEAGTKKVTCTEADITYFIEAEDMTISGSESGHNVDGRFSGGNCRKLAKYSYIYTDPLEGGVYQLITRYYHAKGSNQSIDLYTRSSNGTLTDTGLDFSVGSNSGYNDFTGFTSYILIPDGSSFVINNTTEWSSNLEFDFIALKKVYDVTDASKILGDVNKTSAFTQSDAYTLKKGETKVFTFTNHGYGTDGNSETKSWYNWTIGAYEGSTSKAFTRADFWDNDKGATTGYDQAMSTDGGSSRVALNWDRFKEDMADATVVATLSYSVDGTYSISAVQTGHVNNYIYYVNHSVSDLTADELTIKLGVEYSWSEIISVEQTAIPATITTAGWATLYTDKALDFSNTGLTAYTATLNDNTVTLTKVDDVPANTGVVLKGDANTYSIPVIASSETERGSMTGNATEGVELDENTAYILGINNSGNAQFFINSAGTIAAGKAYLPATGGAKALTVVFANDPTGIANVNAAEAAQPAKRIENGQLIIEKNGKRYNAAGAEL